MSDVTSVKMEISRLIPNVTPVDLSAQSTSAVAAIHKSMVVLRGELVKRDQKIRHLEEELKKHRTNENNNSKQFEDIFDLHVEEDGKVMEKSQVDFDQILLYEEAEMKREEQADKDEDERQQNEFKEDEQVTTYDPIMAFVLSEEEADEDEQEQKEYSTINLVPFKDIQVGYGDIMYIKKLKQIQNYEYNLSIKR